MNCLLLDKALKCWWYARSFFRKGIFYLTLLSFSTVFNVQEMIAWTGLVDLRASSEPVFNIYLVLLVLCHTPSQWIVLHLLNPLKNTVPGRSHCLKFQFSVGFAITLLPIVLFLSFLLCFQSLFELLNRFESPLLKMLFCFLIRLTRLSTRPKESMIKIVWRGNSRLNIRKSICGQFTYLPSDSILAVLNRNLLMTWRCQNFRTGSACDLCFSRQESSSLCNCGCSGCVRLTVILYLF
jgi:hypothetical protein